MLQLQPFEEVISITPAGTDDVADSLGTRKQLDALSDDPDEIYRQLQVFGGPAALIRVDGLEGGSLPPKAQIKSIRLIRDQFAAENHDAQLVFLDIVTQPGLGPIHTTLSCIVRPTGLTALR